MMALQRQYIVAKHHVVVFKGQYMALYHHEMHYNIVIYIAV